LTLQFIAESCGGRIVSGEPSMFVRGVSTDSRGIERGNLFVALTGPNFDGHDFLGDVCGKGAAAALIAKGKRSSLPPLLAGVECDDPRQAFGRIGAAHRRTMPVRALAIAGSNGKTSTKDLVASVLRERLLTVASPASFNNEIGVPATLLQLEQRHQAGVFEVGTNHPGELRPLLEMIEPEGGVITSIGREHLEFFGSIEHVLEEEGTLAEVLPPSGFLVIQGEGYGADQLAQRSRARVIRVGFGEGNDWRISSVEMGADGTRFVITTETKDFSGEYVTRLLGTHQVVNATFAVVVGKELGLGRAEIQRGLASCQGAKMRLQLRQIDDFLVLDDAYNANADSMQAALDTLRNFPCKGRRIAVLGDMAELGHSADMAHEEVGRRAAKENVDCLVAVGKSSRIMANAALRAGLNDVVVLPEVESAGAAVIELVRPGDVVLVKASRSVRLERLVECLAQRFGTTDRRPAES
jgi:UDP-N-acetylmuramoyl-tripeptide--D-alanyl-D-alanine ligase